MIQSMKTDGSDLMNLAGGTNVSANSLTSDGKDLYYLARDNAWGTAA